MFLHFLSQPHDKSTLPSSHSNSIRSPFSAHRFPLTVYRAPHLNIQRNFHTKDLQETVEKRKQIVSATSLENLQNHIVICLYV